MSYNLIFTVIKYWTIAIIIVFPLVLSLCKSATKADAFNTLVNNVE